MNKVKDRTDEKEEFEKTFVKQYLNLTPPPRYIKSSEKEWKIGNLINERYKINNIKKGGMGIVYICHDHVAHEDIAIKTYIEQEEYYRETIERFRSEALTWLKLGKQENIVQVKYVLDIDHQPHIFMEYIRSEDADSPSLRAMMKKEPLSLERCLDFSLQFCDGMIHAVSVVPGLIHNDIKPENILITPNGVLKVSDFGLVKVFYQLSSLGVFKGTAAYTSPEQCLGLAMTDTSSDIYSFGVVLYEMFTGSHPFVLGDETNLIKQHLLETPKAPEEVNPQIPKGLSGVILKCMKKNPEDRYRNFKELKDDLSKFCNFPRKPSPVQKYSPNFDIIEAQRYVNRGISMTTFGRYHEAISLFNLALKINPENTEALSRKGIALVSMGQYDKAGEYFDKYLKLKPCDVDVLNHKGSILNLQGKKKEALECFDKALNYQAQNNEVLYNKAVTLFSLGLFEEAEKTLAKIEEKTIGDSCQILQEVCLLRLDPTYTSKGIKPNRTTRK